MISFKMQSLFSLDRKLKNLPKKVGNAIKRKAARAAAKPVLAMVRSLSPAKSGAMKKSFKIRAYKSRKKDIFGVRIVSGKKWFQGDQFYTAFQVFGTKYQAPNDFMKRAVAATKSGSQRILVDELRRLIREARGRA